MLLEVRSPGLADLTRCMRMLYHTDVGAFYSCSLLEEWTYTVRNDVVFSSQRAFGDTRIRAAVYVSVVNLRRWIACSIVVYLYLLQLEQHKLELSIALCCIYDVVALFVSCVNIVWNKHLGNTFPGYLYILTCNCTCKLFCNTTHTLWCTDKVTRYKF